ncbi:MAG: DUF736 domain-containing protein [Parvibaculum sp.]|nr:DUF736 domain-containing protein [Parvibaculum sp.]
MAIIGEFIRTQTGFSGHVRTLVLDHELVLVPIENPSAEDASEYPDYRIRLAEEEGPEVGAVWKRTGQAVTGYNFVLDDPSFAQPIRAHLFATDDDGRAWAVRWIRPKKQDEQG